MRDHHAGIFDAGEAGHLPPFFRRGEPGPAPNGIPAPFPLRPSGGAIADGRRRWLRHETLGDGAGDELGARPHSQLFPQPAHVVFCRARADAKARGERLIADPLDEERKHLQLARSQERTLCAFG